MGCRRPDAYLDARRMQHPPHPLITRIENIEMPFGEEKGVAWSDAGTGKMYRPAVCPRQKTCLDGGKQPLVSRYGQVNCNDVLIG